MGLREGRVGVHLDEPAPAAAAQGPRVVGHPRPYRRGAGVAEAHDAPAGQAHDEPGDLRPERPGVHLSAGEGDAGVGVREPLGLAPPPALGEPAPPPVLLPIDLGTGELPAVAVHFYRPGRRPAQEPRVPVLVQAGHRLEDAGPPEGPVRPPPGFGDDQVEVGAWHVHAQAAVVTDEGVVGARAHGVRVGPGTVEGVRDEACRDAVPRRGRHPDGGPRPARGTVDADERDQDTSGADVGEPPEVALHVDPVGAGRVAEGQVGAGGPVAGQERAHGVRDPHHEPSGQVSRTAAPPSTTSSSAPGSWVQSSWGR